MINLTSLEDLITSLIAKSLGEDAIIFKVFDNGFDCISNKCKFTASKSQGLRIYDNGNIYLIQDILPDNFSEAFDVLIRNEAERLSKYYKLITYTEKVGKDFEVKVYKLTLLL